MQRPELHVGKASAPHTRVLPQLLSPIMCPEAPRVQVHNGLCIKHQRVCVVREGFRHLCRVMSEQRIFKIRMATRLFCDL